MKKRHRMVKMSPADGSMCKAEPSQAEKCMMPECREWVWGKALGRGPGKGVENHKMAPPPATTTTRPEAEQGQGESTAHSLYKVLPGAG
jgi:hypothetical protein